MRRAATWVVVVGLVALGAIAAIEGFLRDDEPGAPGPTTTAAAAPADLPGQLEQEGARGLLYMTVRRGARCRVQAVRLPTLAVESDFPVPGCRFAVTPSGLVAAGSDCRGTGALALADGTVVDVFRGCAPAWRPARGELTFIRDADVLAVPRSCATRIDACAEVVLSRRDIRSAFAELDRDAPGASESVREIAWLDESRIAAVVRRFVGSGEDRRSLDFIVVFEGRRPLGPLGFGNRCLSGLTADRAGRRFLASGDVIQGIFELDERGAFVDTFTLPQGVPQVSSVAVSPDGSWGAARGGRASSCSSSASRRGAPFSSRSRWRSSPGGSPEIIAA
jgi:hypothetical protein